VSDSATPSDPYEDATVEPVAEDATVEMVIPDEVIDPEPVQTRVSYRAPLWVTLGLATIAIVALGVALAAFQASRELRDNWTAFQTEIFTSGELAAGTLNSTSSGLSLLADQSLSFTANVDQVVPIVVSIPFKRTIEVPIITSILINEVIETTITVAGPFGWDVDVDVTVPLDLAVPVNITVPIEIDEVIEVDTSTRLQLSVPVELDLEETGLAGFIRQMSTNLTRLANAMPTAG